MHFGLFCLMPQRDRSRTPRAIYQDTLEDVLAAEAAGFEIAWFAEHGRPSRWSSSGTANGRREAEYDDLVRQQLRRHGARPQTELLEDPNGCGFEGVTVETPDELTEALREAGDAQARGTTTFIEVILNQELGEPFRRDAMTKPVMVAGIDPADMRPQRPN